MIMLMYITFVKHGLLTDHRRASSFECALDVVHANDHDWCLEQHLSFCAIIMVCDCYSQKINWLVQRHCKSTNWTNRNVQFTMLTRP